MWKWLTRGSWKTTSTGLLSIIGGLVRLGFAIAEGKVTEEAIMTTAITVLTGLGLLAARDNNRSSEEIGVTPADKVTREFASGKARDFNTRAGLLLLVALTVGLFLTTAATCRRLDPGADPLVVRTEQFLTTAESTFLFTLQVDHQDRGFWRAQAPAFHAYCETLRVPTPYPHGSTNLLPQWRVALLSLDDVKLDYQASRASSNALWSALVTVESLRHQASAWLTIVTNRLATP